MYDAIVVGARVAGSPTAMLLARAGHRVLLVDRDTFPSDTLSTHLIRIEGVALLSEWGVLDRVIATGAPPIGQTTAVIMGQQNVNVFESVDGRPGLELCPRRWALDTELVQAAREAGAEVREGFSVSGLSRDAAGRVNGVVGRDASGATVHEEATVVIGADGRHSRVARELTLEEYETVPPLICGYYTYFSNLPLEGTEFRIAPGAAVIGFPTNNGQVCLAVERPDDEFAEMRGDIESFYMAAVEAAAPDLYEAVRAATREEPFRGGGEQRQYFRKPYGDGWVLIGDAGLHVDPTLGLGITKAFTEAAMLAPALSAVLNGTLAFEEALAGFQQQRDAVWIPLSRENVGASQAVTSGRMPRTPSTGVMGTPSS
ncbi:MAG: NAD(P)/FAD-dependent oxidoreductase [Chloroflexi bacterium]|nr:NAD(P)/FAD-dependent oxidoreductase [Chloroflexota bacterium]MDA1147333.1 NAD(P)/FAD-dependent oxidoreductase [Chloroflexota bacterium]MQC82502.1 NAD(P)/FAD-dependent oxidoreductase [Chloroflexota bacterium]MQC83142.1 NAD(P)/FAD-dependent oxidoreductase [Chloroflexota bacterium]